MLAACLAHSSELLAGQSNSPLGAALVTMGLLATPTFLLLSGVVCGYLSTTDSGGLSWAYRWRLIDRGLFLLLVGHLLLGLILGTWYGVLAALGHSLYITDAIGIGQIVAAFALQRVSKKNLFIGGVAIFVIATAVTVSIGVPHSHNTRYLMRLFLGLKEVDENDGGYMVPIIPYLGIFIVGLACGLEYGARRVHGITMQQIATVCIRAGLAFVGIALILKVAAVIVRPHLSLSLYPMLSILTNVRQKLPPGIDYVLMFGGTGVFITGIICHLSKYEYGRQLVGTLAVLGRASLVIFLIQFWLYYFPVKSLHAHPLSIAWFAIVLPLSWVALWWVAWWWDRGNYNRFLTLGLRRFYSVSVSPVPGS